MANAGPHHRRQRRTVKEYHHDLDEGCRRAGIEGGARVWRSVKSLSQLVAIAGGIWLGATGMINPTFAFAGVLSLWLGTEALESMLVNVGESLSEPDGRGAHHDGDVTYVPLTGRDGADENTNPEAEPDQSHER